MKEKISIKVTYIKKPLTESLNNRLSWNYKPITKQTYLLFSLVILFNNILYISIIIVKLLWFIRLLKVSTDIINHPTGVTKRNPLQYIGN